MRIGILTLPLCTNYGGNLQAYALQTVLQRMGHEVVVLDVRDKPIQLPPLSNRIWTYIKRILLKLGGKYHNVILYSTAIRNAKTKVRHINRFIYSYINRAVVDNLDDAKNLNLDAIVVGSDQVWRGCYFRFFWGKDMAAAFTGFLEEPIIRIAYAASFGTDEWEFTDEETTSCRELIRKFSMVSTREVSGLELCRKYLGCNDCHHVLDPTMLLDRTDYIKLSDEAGMPHSEGSLLCYILDETDYKISAVREVVAQRGLKPCDVNFQDRSFFMRLPKDGGYPPIEKWLRGFEDATMVITDSFHACVFSILFNKPFIVFGNAERGMTRFNSLLSTFGLEKCLIADKGNFEIPIVDYNWERVNKILAERKAECWQLLSRAISEGKKL